MTTDLSKLTTSADKWEETAEEFKNLEAQYRRDVHGVSLGRSWQGLSADAANRRFSITLNEYRAAQKEARAVAALLRDAHAQFVELQGKVKGLREGAVKAGMAVSEKGHVSLDYERLSSAARSAYAHDPGYQESTRAAVAEWDQALTAAVKAVSDADDGVRIALEAVVIDSDLTDGTVNGFNAAAKHDIEEYEADYLKEIALRINKGDPVSSGDITEAQRSFRDNSENKIFSQTLLNSLGASNTIKLTNSLNDLAYGESGAHKKEYLNLQAGLATTLATATRDTDSKFYKDFRDDLRRAGIQKYGLDAVSDDYATSPTYGQKAVGYQSLVTLMQHGDGYSGQFLKDMADDIRSVEDKKQGGDPDIWDLRGRYSGRENGWFANDPLDGVLGIMSKDPATATAYLDPGPDGKNDNLTYLLSERDWDQRDTTEWRNERWAAGKDTFDADARAGLGRAIESGTTGHRPGSDGSEFGRHSVGQTRIMHDVVNYLDYGAADGKYGEDKNNPRIGKADELLARDDYSAMRAPLARALADYAPDTVDIINGDAPGGRAGQKDPHVAGEDSQIQNSRSSLLRMMRGVSEADDTRNFEIMYQAQKGYMTQEMMNGDHSNDLAVTNQARRIGEATGALNAIGGDVKMDIRNDEISKATDKRFYGYHIGGGAITGIPVIGDAAQRLVDISLNDWLSGVQAEQGALSREEISRLNDTAQDSLDNYFNDWYSSKNVDKQAIEHASSEARQSYENGRQIAFDALRSRN
ncbi:hypothetical protein [Streptomyces californicus]|uniref:hypothetical protein n=1 Tax=Streptomyces californicus TaxID=67351 RepID=UPI0037B29153